MNPCLNENCPGTCKLHHPTWLLDPPEWIHSKILDGMIEFSMEEIRLHFLKSPTTFFSDWDNLYMNNYFIIYDKLNSMNKPISMSQRYFDLRRMNHPPMFDKSKFFAMKKQKSEKIEVEESIINRNYSEQRNYDDNRRRLYTEKRPYNEERRGYSDEKRYHSEERRTYERKPYERKNFEDRRFDERKYDDKKKYEDRKYEGRKSFEDRKYDDRRFEGRKSYDDRRYDERKYDDRKYDDKKMYYDKERRNFGDRKYNDDRKYDNKSFNDRNSFQKDFFYKKEDSFYKKNEKKNDLLENKKEDKIFKDFASEDELI